MNKPIAYDLACGLGGWTEGLLAEGYDVTGFDIEAHEYGGEKYPAKLVIQDILTLHGSRLKDAALIVASPPCQEFSYMAMPWKRAKQIGRALRGEDEFPDKYKGSRTKDELTALFDACFRIQREASAAAGRHIPMVVENVRGANPWVGKAPANFGSYYLWGDIPNGMPKPKRAVDPSKEMGSKNSGGSWFNIAHNTTSGVSNNPDGRKNPGFRFDGSGKSFQTESVDRHIEGSKGGGDWFGAGAALQTAVRAGSNTPARKAASAKIAKIPFALSSFIAKAYHPMTNRPATVAPISTPAPMVEMVRAPEIVLPEGPFSCILADPPWSYSVFSKKGEKRSASQHYSTMTLDDIKAMPVAACAAKDAHLFLWATAPNLPQALEVMAAWGFKYSAVAFVWVKLNKGADRNQLRMMPLIGDECFVGMGHTTRQNAEFVLLGRRGSPKRLSKAVRQIIVSPRREHSRKPDEAHARIEAYCAGPRLELFARESRPGWTTWGNQSTKFDAPAPKLKRAPRFPKDQHGLPTIDIEDWLAEGAEQKLTPTETERVRRVKLNLQPDEYFAA